jgi:hypothetical protein
MKVFSASLVASIILNSLCLAQEASPPAAIPWKAAVAVAKITPEVDMWMAGYAARKKPSEGVAQDLYAKAVAFEDEAGQRLVIVTNDMIGVRREIRDNVARRCQAEYKLAPESLLMNASHTHCAPEYRPRSGRGDEGAKYQKFYEDTAVALVGEALANLKPAKLSYAKSRCGFAMNRRKNYLLPADDINAKRAPTPDGPVDHAVPVLCVNDALDKPIAILFGYACHNTCLSSVTSKPAEPKYMFNGDYSGFAQKKLQETYPGVVAMYVNGCSGDQNPYPRHDALPTVLPLQWAEHHGTTLAYAVVAAIQAGPRPVVGPLRMAIEDVELVRNNDKPGHKYPVQVVRFGDFLTLVALGSETVVDYSLRLKQEIHTPAVWIAGYSNDYSGYIPSRRVAIEGGYEAANDFQPDVEERIVGKVHELLSRLESAKPQAGTQP